ncbi:MAG: DUF4974 domain-containing protein [Bacteroidetes bacterium]|nr:DUF4974 domain-containing protein [Bacteroidota bacterium]
MKPTEDIDILLAKYFAAETNAEQESYIEKWRSLSEENELLFVQSAQVFAMADTSFGTNEFDTNPAWNKIKEKKTGRTIPFNSFRFNFVNIAASILLVAGLSFVWFKYKSTDSETHLYTLKTTDKILNGTLPDGSTFTLNRHSAITYDTVLFSKNRTLAMQGEGFFTVVHNDRNPFKIETNGLIITDIGTSFNVKSLNNGLVQVNVKEGIVELDNESIESQQIKAGEQANYLLANHSLTKTEITDKNYTAYMDKVLIFDNVPLVEITRTLADVYACTFEYANKELMNCRFTGTFNNESLDDILKIITETLKLTETKNESNYVINGPGCN